LNLKNLQCTRRCTSGSDLAVLRPITAVLLANNRCCSVVSNVLARRPSDYYELSSPQFPPEINDFKVMYFTAKMLKICEIGFQGKLQGFQLNV